MQFIIGYFCYTFQLKLEKFEHGIVVISGTGTTGLQYSVRLHPLNMASLVLKITPVQGHGKAHVVFD